MREVNKKWKIFLLVTELLKLLLNLTGYLLAKNEKTRQCVAIGSDSRKKRLGAAVRRGFLTPWPPYLMETINFHLSASKERPLPDSQ